MSRWSAVAASAHANQVRIVASLIATAALTAIALASSSLLAFLFLLPVLTGCAPAIIASPGFVDHIEGWRRFFEQTRDRGAAGGRYGQLFLRPLGAGSLTLWNITYRVPHPHVRAGVRLLGMGYFWAAMVGLLLAALYAIVAVVLFVLVCMAAWWILSSVLGASGSAGGSSTLPTRGDQWKKRLAGSRIVNEGFLSDTPSGMKVNEDGQLVNEGFFADTPTGLKLNDEGQVVREGFFADNPTGIKINEDGHIVREGIFADTETGLRINEDGQLTKEGFLADQPTGTKFKKD